MFIDRAIWMLALAVAMQPCSAYGDGRTDYLLHCGGCHGTDGLSALPSVSSLGACVGDLLITADGRAYLMRLPRIRGALLRDDARMAAMLNYVAGNTGSSSTVTAAEVAEARARSDDTPFDGRQRCHG